MYTLHVLASVAVNNGIDKKSHIFLWLQSFYNGFLGIKFLSDNLRVDLFLFEVIFDPIQLPLFDNFITRRCLLL